MTSPSTWAVAALLVLTAFPAAAQITGPAAVIDGDTITVQYQRIRLWGIDAPERGQPCDRHTQYPVMRNEAYDCGAKASDALWELVRGRTVSCEQRDRDRYGRIVAQCSTEFLDINAAMVLLGWAVDYSHYSHGRYAAEEAEARNAKRGMWSGRFEMPSDWRRQHKGGR